MTLHIINTFSEDHQRIKHCFDCAIEDDDIVFLSTTDTAIKSSRLMKEINTIKNKGINIHALEKKEPITNNPLLNSISDKNFLMLAIKHQKSITWF
ncbi:MAG: hypothetical protein ACRBCS_03330 [Cellvibrionaceae bacterium]